jgi:hypothetical protein
MREQAGQQGGLGMKGILTGTAALAMLIGSLGPAMSQDLAAQIVGVWKRVSLVNRDMATGATTTLYGERPGGSAIFTRGGHFFWTIIADGRKAPDAWVLTDANKAALYDSATFGTGTYKVDGATVSLTYDSSSNQIWTRSTRRAEMQVSGKVLTWTSPPIPGPNGTQYVAIATMERVE